MLKKSYDKPFEDIINEVESSQSSEEGPLSGK
jgi:hypothetical protein